jgi:hypothetical protein
MNQRQPINPPGALIDDPSPFATLETWERHLADLKKLADSTEKELAVERAEKHIVLLKQMPGWRMYITAFATPTIVDRTARLLGGGLCS